MGRPDLADWKTKICLIIVPKQVEEKVSGLSENVYRFAKFVAEIARS